MVKKMIRLCDVVILLVLVGCHHKVMSESPRPVKHAHAKHLAHSKHSTHSKRPVHPKHSPPSKHQVQPVTSRYSMIKDAAPLKPPTLSLVNNAKPKNESFSRYGNPDSYAVNGKRYQVMRSASGYKTKGLASWYGTKFHSQRTSSGEGYDMYAMTAAHRTLPLPTYVRVKNLSNGREAVVKVNDRGPFSGDRVIDLSYAAAHKLGLLPKGTAPVEIEALTIRGRENGKPTATHFAHYYVQAGAFKSVSLAKLLKEKLTKVTPSPVFIEKYKQQYIVKVGPLATKHLSDNLTSKLARQGVTKSFTMLY